MLSHSSSYTTINLGLTASGAAVRSEETLGGGVLNLLPTLGHDDRPIRMSRILNRTGVPRLNCDA